MEIDITYVESPQYFLLRVSGQIILEGVPEGSRGVINHERYEQGIPTLWDLRDAEFDEETVSPTFTSWEIPKDIVDKRQGVAVAVVVSNKDHYALASQYFSNLSVHYNWVLFYSVRSAEIWLSSLQED